MKREPVQKYSFSMSLVFLVSLAFIFIGISAKVFSDDEFLRGDVNADGRVSISDSLMIRRFLFNGDRPPTCRDSADVNDDKFINISDQIEILRFLFLDGPSPESPFPENGPDPTQDDKLTCESYSLIEPQQTTDLIRIGDVNAAAGDQVQVPVFVTNSVEIEAFQLVVEYDPATFSPNVSVSTSSGISREGSYYDGLEPNSGDFGAVSATDEADIFVVGFIPAFIEIGFELPAGEEKLAFNITGSIPEDAPEGIVSLTPVNGPGGEGIGPAGMRNELTHAGDARFVSIVPEVKAGLLNIVGDQIFFLRGDANADGSMNVADAQFTLNYLFLGSEEPPCLDALDSNDDGKVNISDAMASLNVLFLRVTDLPSPYPGTGTDPTPDNLSCLISSN